MLQELDLTGGRVLLARELVLQELDLLGGRVGGNGGGRFGARFASTKLFLQQIYLDGVGGGSGRPLQVFQLLLQLGDRPLSLKKLASV